MRNEIVIDITDCVNYNNNVDCVLIGYNDFKLRLSEFLNKKGINYFD